MEMLTSDLLIFFCFLGPISKGGQKHIFPPSADTHESSPPYLLKNKMSLKKFKDPSVGSQ